MNAIGFYIIAAVIVFSALAAISRASLSAAFNWLFVCLLSVAGLFILLRSPFLACLQIVLAATMTLILHLSTVLADEGGARTRVVNFSKVLGALAAVYLGFVLAIAVLRPPFVMAPESGESYESPVTFAEMLLDKYALAFELSGVLILISIMALVIFMQTQKKSTMEPRA